MLFLEIQYNYNRMYILYFQFYILILGQGLTEILVICMDSVFCLIKWLAEEDIFLGLSCP